MTQRTTVSLLLLVALACGEAAHVREVEDRASTSGASRSEQHTAPPDAGEAIPDAGTVEAPQPETEGLGPPYPIVLVHGFFAMARMGPVEYWWRIPGALRDAGETVYVADTAPYQTPSDRALILAGQVDAVLAETGAAKVNLIGHSMGGLDARVLVSALGYGDRVASVTTVGTPHRGTEVADAVLGVLPPLGERIVGGAIDAFGRLIDGDEQDVVAAANVLSTAGMRAFNTSHPDDPRVAYLSIVGRTGVDPFFLLHGRDYCDVGLLPTYALLELLGHRNDGLVPLSSQKWGEVVLTVEADHLNQVGQPLGVGLQFDVLETYREHARLLHARGF